MTQYTLFMEVPKYTQLQFYTAIRFKTQSEFYIDFNSKTFQKLCGHYSIMVYLL